VGDLWTAFIWFGLGASEGFVDWMDMAQDRVQWEICGLD
jgi:hypothetical protein